MRRCPIEPRDRDTALDALRALAVVLMVCAHVARLTSAAARPWWADFGLTLEPLCQALFVGLVGVSLGLSWARTRAPALRWVTGHLRRAAGLFALSVLFFLLERGPSWPHVLLSTGILAIIAAAIAILAPLVPLRGALPAVGALTAGAWAGAALLEARGVWILGLNAGNGPLLPTAIHAGLGCFALLCWRRFGRAGAASVLALAALGAAAVVCAAGSLGAAFDSDWSRIDHRVVLQGRGHGLQNAWDLLRGRDLPDLRVTFYNTRPGMIALPAALVAGFWAAAHALRRWLPPLGGALGRHALGVYVLHLGLVALPVLATGRTRPLTATWHAWAWLLVVLAVCQGYAVLRDRRAAEIPHA